MWTWKENRLNPVNLWQKRIEADLATYPARFEKSEAEGLLANYTETAREARRLYLGHIALLAYGALTIFTARDAAFYSPQSAIPLPLLGVMISANFFSVAIPIMLLAFWLYLQIYLGQMRRYRRLLYLAADQYPDLRPKITPDARFPWIATIAERAGPTASVVRGLFDFIAYRSAPLLIFGIWWRVLAFRSNWYEWLSPNGHGLPAAGAVGLVFLVSGFALKIVLRGKRQMDEGIAVKLTNADLRSKFLRSSTDENDLKRTGRWSIAAKLEGISPCPPPPFSAQQTKSLVGRLFKWLRGNRPLNSYFILVVYIPLMVFPNSWLRSLDDFGKKQWFLPYVNLEFAKLSRPAEPGVLDIVGINLPRVRLPYANLRGAYLERANLLGAHLEEADFRDAHLEGANLIGAYLEGADLCEAHLEGAYLRDAHLEGASLNRANLEGARLWKAHLKGVVGFNEANIKNADLVSADMEGIYLKGAHLEGVRLSGAHLKCAELDEAHLEGAKFERAHLGGAHFNGAHLEGADFREANMEGTILAKAHLEGASLKGTCLDGANLIGAHLEGTDLTTWCENCPEPVKEILRERSGKPADFTDAQAKTVCGQGWPGYEGRIKTSSSYCTKYRTKQGYRRLRIRQQEHKQWQFHYDALPRACKKQNYE